MDYLQSIIDYIPSIAISNTDEVLVVSTYQSNHFVSYAYKKKKESQVKSEDIELKVINPKPKKKKSKK